MLTKSCVHVIYARYVYVETRLIFPTNASCWYLGWWDLFSRLSLSWRGDASRFQCDQIEVVNVAGLTGMNRHVATVCALF